MKLFKNMLFIIALITINPLSARSIGSTSRPAPTEETPAPGVKRSFQQLLMQIRTMPPAQVINNEGVFTPTFENLIKSSELDPKLMEALLQAGKNLHMPLSGKNDDDLELVAHAQERIDAAIDSFGPETPKTIDQEPVKTPVKEQIKPVISKEQEIKARASEKYVIDAFSKVSSLNNVNEQFVNDLKKRLLTSFNITDNVELLALMTNGLVKRFPNDTVARKMKIETVGRIIFGQKLELPKGPKVITEEAPAEPVTPPSKDVKPAGLNYEKITYLRQDTLERRAKQLLSTKTAEETIDILNAEFASQMERVWKQKGIKAINTKLNQLNEQIEATVNKLREQQMPIVQYQPAQKPAGKPVTILPAPTVIQQPAAQPSADGFITLKKNNNEDLSQFTKRLCNQNKDLIIDRLFIWSKSQNRYVFLIQAKEKKAEDLINKLESNIKKEYPNAVLLEFANEIPNAIINALPDNSGFQGLVTFTNKTLGV